MRLAAMIVGAVVAMGCGRAADHPQDSGSAAGSGSQGAAETSTNPPAPPPPVARPRRPVDDLVDKADQMLSASVALDYRRPMLEAPNDRAAVRKAFYEACRSGDARSCWMVREVSVGLPEQKPQLYEADAVARIVDNCRGGDRLSCSAMATRDMQDIDMLPGHHARNRECALLGDCKLDGLTRECQAGYGDSCVKLREGQSLSADHDGVTAAARRLTLEGCRAGLMRDCYSAEKLYGDVTKAEDRAARLATYEQMCLVGLSCYPLVKLYLPSDPEKARTVWEQGCQLNHQCEELWSSYTANPPVVREPEPGRAAKLRDFLCKKYKVCLP